MDDIDTNYQEIQELIEQETGLDVEAYIYAYNDSLEDWANGLEADLRDLVRE